ncbi:hypothetical protein BGZ95_011549 [Linnemannia exigua]|uniref:RGS domain-containing protein n=1 Tax=Linnemannia exigua TaxID=604196 RepID=A0AAD4D9Q3_9FUNG|nr:hypothetical protein BGZ95_011549 [Linnemannia exigua]
MTDGGAPTPTAATTPTTIATTNSTTFSSSSSSSFRPRSRATDLLLNLEASSNDARFQEILHNTIALDLFRQFCFQEYSIENLLFWMDVEVFAKPNLEMQRADRLKYKILQKRLEKQQRAYRQRGRSRTDSKEGPLDEKQQNVHGECDEKENLEVTEEEMKKLRQEVEDEDAQFAVQHARYIYLTYIDSYAPLQVNLSDESRTDIPWPILDASDNSSNDNNHSRNNSGASKDGKKGIRSRIGSGNDSRTEEVVGWPLDRHMFDGAQEHTYQLMKGHTLVRFEDSELWKSAQRMMHDQPTEYEKATVHGPLHSHYCPDTSVILSTVARSRSRHPTAKLQTLYNWNNSTTDLDRSRDKEEALAKTMSQYFGPIPPSIRHPGRVILGLGPRRHGGGFDDDDYEDDEDEFDDFDTFEEHVHGVSGPMPTAATSAANMLSDSKRSSTSSTGGLAGGFRKNRFTKRLSGRGKGGSGQHHSNASDDLVSGDLYDDSYSMDQHDLSHDGIDSVANGRRTTRWMVAGYFNDQVRLTAAQRKRLLRRNNKLTKFFGSRVDGTLRPVEETEDGGFIVPPSSRSSAAAGVGSLAAVGAGSVPMLGSPLAYALSSSTIHDMDRKGRPKKNKSKRDSGNGHEVLFHFPGASKSASGSRSMNILQKFKRNSGEYYDNSNTSSTVRSSLFMNTNRKSLDEIGIGSSNSNNSRHFRSATSVDIPPVGRRILAAHPHPLWSGSLSDHEVDLPSAYERRRQLSILSIMGNGLNNSSTSPQSPHAPGLTPTTPTELYASPRGMDQDGGATNKPAHTTGGGSSDRQAMSSRRKKADKLSTFFGAQLTPQELSSQLRMEDDSDLVSSTASQSTTLRQDKNKNDLQQHPVPRSSSESDKHKSNPTATGLSVLSVNQLSHRDRTLLWKRNKKLRGILGESLQESEVALSLTIPVLLGSSTRLRNSMSSSRRASAGSPSLRKKRLATATSSSSLHGKHDPNETQTGGDDNDDEEEGEGEDDSEEYEDLNSSSNLVRPKVAKNSSSKTRARRSSNAGASASMRARRSSVASNTSSVYRRCSHQHGRSGRAGSVPGLNRAISVQSLDSFQSVDTVLDEDLDEDLRETEEELGIQRYSHRRRTSSIRPHGYSHLSPRYRQIHAAAGLASTCGDGATTASGAAAAAERFNRKKKMDKIQQFLGDRVPEQDLWMGTVGREKTKEMLEKNLLSSVNNVQQDGVSVAGGGAAVVAGSGGAGLSRSGTGSKLTPRFKKSAFPGRSKSTSTTAPKSDDNPCANEKEKSGDNSISSASTKRSKLRPVVVTTGSRAAGGVRMERSLSDPPRLEDGASNGLGVRSPGVHQPPYQWHTTVSRLRQQLAAPVLAPSVTGAVSGGGGGVDTIAASASATSPTVSSPISFSSSSVTSPRLSTSSNPNPGNPTITTKSTFAPTSTSAPATADASASPNSPTNLSPGFMTVLFDEEGEDDSATEGGEGAVDDESAQILPRLRAMSGKDQERFLKRAEKLERLFGHFPPSALLHRSLTTASASSSETTEPTAAAAEGVAKESGRGASRSSEGEEMAYAATRGGETSMFQLAAFLAAATTSTQDTHPSSSSSVSSPTSAVSPMTPTAVKKKSEEDQKWISETMDALAEVEWAATRRTSATSGEGVVESLVISPV